MIAVHAAGMIARAAVGKAPTRYTPTAPSRREAASISATASMSTMTLP
ncbi:hypothetical protein [Cryobacterium sp. GrIS_2_6]|nr:hypothetical protein [Cryobacterium psychrotolerans]